eukprot:jgi/Psemu1/44233/gm1.44233_g
MDQALKVWTTHVTNLKTGVPYNPGDFKHKGGFVAVKVIDDGTYKKPYEDMLDLLKRMTMELGRQFGIGGKKELVFLKSDYLKLGTFSRGAMKDLKYIIINPAGGFCKMNDLNINNAVVNVQYPMVVEDPENPACIIKLIYFYWKRCHESQVCFFCHVNNNKKKTTNVRDFAEQVLADFKDWGKYTPHVN